MMNSIRTLGAALVAGAYCAAIAALLYMSAAAALERPAADVAGVTAASTATETDRRAIL